MILKFQPSVEIVELIFLLDTNTAPLESFFFIAEMHFESAKIDGFLRCFFCLNFDIALLT